VKWDEWILPMEGDTRAGGQDIQVAASELAGALQTTG
jgi:hypothetical protein